ncbi:PIN domain-like protein [Flammula alnicola]|nr:PIN domain-like protein [Flammula alnicola]
MGVRDLWTALAPASEKRTLTQIVVTEGFEQKRRPGRCLHTGIDCSIWMNQAQTATQHGNGKGTQIGLNPAIRNLYNRLCRQLELPSVPIFIFDGLDRPSVKRGNTVKKSKSHHLTKHFQQLLEAFGFHWYTAPGEAEAELAELNQQNLIDAVFTEDSDALVFGATCVIRTPNVKEEGDWVKVFSLTAIKSDPRVALDDAGLFFMAILCGGDYNPGGLPGCGWRTALQLARTDLATDLFCAARRIPTRQQMSDFLTGWRQDFRSLLADNPDNVLDRRYPLIAKNVASDFPAVDVLSLYAHPVTSWTTNQVPDSASWCLRPPNLTKIALLCEKYFSWGSLGEIVPRFKATLWPGVVFRYLLLLPDVGTRFAHRPFANIHILKIYQFKLGPGPPLHSPNVHGYSIEVSTESLTRETTACLDLTPEESSSGSKSSSKAKQNPHIWVPASVLRSAMPSLVERFHRISHSSPPQEAAFHPVLANGEEDLSG